MVDGGDQTLDQHALDVLVRRRGYDDKVVAVLLRARERLLLAVGLAIARLWEGRSASHARGADPRASGLRASLCFEQENTRLRCRLERIEARRRSHYTPSERFQILVFMKTWLLSAEQTAQRFLVSPRTISRWLKEATREPAKQTIGCLVKAVPPRRAYCHVVRDLVFTMETLTSAAASASRRPSPAVPSRSAPRRSAAGASAAPTTADACCGRPVCRGALPEPRVDG
jgi:hypothetical protein